MVALELWLGQGLEHGLKLGLCLELGRQWQGLGLWARSAPSHQTTKHPPSILSAPSQHPPSTPTQQPLSAPISRTPTQGTLLIPPAEHTPPMPPDQQPMPGRSNRVPQSFSWDMPLQLWKNMCFFLVLVVI